MDRAAPIETFDQFWPFYVRQHRRAGNRAFHFAGTTLGLLCLTRALGAREPFMLVWGLVASYGLAWIGHFFIERNRPATFQYPLWSFVGDFKMYGLMWARRMDAEVRRLDPATNAGEVRMSRPG